MMNKIINGLKYWGQLLLLPIYGLSFLMPRNKRIWVFGSTFGRRFADNPRYLFLYVSQHSKYASTEVRKQLDIWKQEGHHFETDENCKNIRPIWISHNKSVVTFLNKNGYEAYYYHSLKGIWFALRAKVYLFDNYSKDINFWQSGRAVKVNLWHGIPLKKIQHDNKFDKYRHPKNAWEKIKNFPRNLSDEKPDHYVLCPAKQFRDIFASAFQTENVIECGYPRWDGMFGNVMDCYTKAECKVLQSIKKYHSQDRKIVFYAPTFRESEKEVYESFAFKKMNEFAQNNRFEVYIKLHVKSKYQDFVYRKCKDLKHIHVLSQKMDGIEMLLRECDLLITDYSSTMFDYSLLHKSILYYAPDYREYLKNSREMYFEYKDIVQDCMCETPDALLKRLADGLFEYEDKSRAYVNTLVDFDDDAYNLCRKQKSNYGRFLMKHIREIR